MDAYSVLGGPVLRTQVVAAPGAGQEWAFTIPGRVNCQILAVRATFTTSAVVATRHPTLRITDGAQPIADIKAPASQAASLTTLLTWMPDLPAVGVAGQPAYTMGLPRHLVLPAGFIIGSNTPALDVGDTYTGVTVWTREIPNYGEGAQVETALYRSAVHLADVAQALGIDIGG